MKDSAIYIPACDWDSTASLPQSWGPAPPGWKYAKRLVLANDTAHERRGEPVEADADIHAGHITDLGREIRVARLGSETGPLEVVPSQVHLVGREDEVLRCRLFFLADVAARGSSTYLVLYGNPEAPEPHYDTDLEVSGEGYALEVENKHYRAVLGKMNGNWKDHYSKRGPAELVNRHGHGVEGTIHWGPDWSDERVGRYRLTNWDGPPMFDYEVVRGPVCVRIRRWGHPILSVGPQVGRPHKVMAAVTYSFWAGQPYVVMESKLEVLEDVRFRDCRNDEFVIGEQLPERAWMGPDGEIGFGARGWKREDPRWVTHFNRETGEGFGSIHLEFENTNPSWPQPAHAGFSHTGTWVRYPVQHAAMRAGEHVYEKNAYVLHRYEEGGEHRGLADLVGHQERLLNPITQGEAAPAPRPVRPRQRHGRSAGNERIRALRRGVALGAAPAQLRRHRHRPGGRHRGQRHPRRYRHAVRRPRNLVRLVLRGHRGAAPRPPERRRRGRSAPRSRAEMDSAAAERPRPPGHRSRGRVASYNTSSSGGS